MSGLRASLIESENRIIMHSNLLKYIFFAICIPALFIACDKRPTFTPGQGGSGGGGGNSGGADYSGLTTENHPRIIMTDADVAVIKEKLAAGTDENLTRLHESVIAYADKVLTMAPLEYKLVGKRLLDVCTAASNRIISCSYAWRLTGDDRYLKKAEEDLAKVASFPGWNAGGHDLDVGELTHGVGIGYDWLYNDLDEQTRKNVEKAISETNRRRKIQQEYNEEHGITPKTIQKSVRDAIKASIIEEAGAKYNIGKDESIQDVINKLTDEMLKYAAAMEFEKAAELRDQIKELESGL